jgi:GT2 family glycosyltransferase
MSGRGPLVAVVILNWNKAQQTAACVAALHLQSHRNLCVILVDNGSLLGSLGPLEAIGTPVVLLHNGRNLGFTGGVNVGIIRALAEGADYVWLLNNDAEPAPDVLEAMLRVVSADGGIGLASPMIRNADAGDAVEFCGGLREGDTFRTTDDPATYEAWSEAYPDRIWLVGTALLLRRRLVETIGLFDQRFFAYWEDNDYSVRSLAAGFRNVVIPEAVVRHWSGCPTIDPGSKPPHYYYYMARNEILFIRKHVGWKQAVRPLVWAVDRQFRQIDRLNGYPTAIDAVLAGLWDGLRGQGGMFDPERSLPSAATRVLRSARRVIGHHP